MQIMPSTARATDASGRRINVDIGRAAHDWRYNVQIGMSMLRTSYQFAQHNRPNDVARATYARYNAPGHWNQYTYHRGHVAAHVRDWYVHYRDFGGQ